MNRKKVILLMPSLKIGGGNRVLLDLAASLVKNGYDVSIACSEDVDGNSNFPFPSNVSRCLLGKYFRFPSILGRLELLFKLRQIAKKQNCWILFSDPLLCCFLIFLHGEHFIRYVQSDDYGIFDDRKLIKSRILLFLYKSMILLSYKSKITYIFNSNFSLQKFNNASNHLVDEENIVLPGVNISVFTPAKRLVANDKLSICTIARKHPLKGFEYFIQAYHEISKLDIVGKVKVISHDNLDCFDIGDLEVIRPFTDTEITKVLSQSDVFVSTSLWEGFGLPALEAMACGCAVVMTDIDGAKSYAKDGVNCLLYPIKDVKSLVENVKKLNDDRKLLSEIAHNGFETSRSFSTDSTFRQFISVLSKTVN